MMRPKTFFRLFSLLLIFTGLMTIQTPVTYAQPPGPNSCPALVDLALDALADNCQSTDRNSACYGYNQVGATFSEVVADDFFSQPTDQAGLTTLEMLQTAALDIESGQWGIAVMNVQANIPGTLPGQAVTFLLMGDARVENDVAADAAFVPGEGIEITLQPDAVLRSAPMRTANAIDIINTGDVFNADVRDESGEWVRVLYNDLPAWANISEVDGAALDTLPQITLEARSPMQAFYFSTGIGQTTCNEAPDVLTVQSPADITVALNMNGVDVRIGSVIDFRTTDSDEVSVTVRRGTFEILDEAGNVVERVIAGETITAATEADGTIIEFAEPRMATGEEMAVGEIINRALAAVRDDTTLMDAQGRIIHIVIEGETLRTIAQLYEASMDAIVEVNEIDPDIPVAIDDQLVIPNPGTGFVELTAAQPAPQPQGSVIDCTGFQVLTPVDGLAYGLNRFLWNLPANPGNIDTYRVIVYNNNEPRIVGFDTPSAFRTVSGVVDQSTVGGGFDFGWEVQALVNDEVVCVAERVNMQREALPVLPPPAAIIDPIIPPPNLSTGWFCDTSMGVVVFYDGANATDTVTLEYFEGGIFQTLNTSGASGEFFTGAFGIDNGVVSTSSGQSALLTPAMIACF